MPVLLKWKFSAVFLISGNITKCGQCCWSLLHWLPRVLLLLWEHRALLLLGVVLLVGKLLPLVTQKHQGSRKLTLIMKIWTRSKQRHHRFRRLKIFWGWGCLTESLPPNGSHHPRFYLWFKYNIQTWICWIDSGVCGTSALIIVAFDVDGTVCCCTKCCCCWTSGSGCCGKEIPLMICWFGLVIIWPPEL